MGLIDDAAQASRVRVVSRGALRLVEVEEAGRLLDVCEERGIRVLGFEGFDLVGEGVRPDMATIADLSSVGAAESVREARLIVSKISRSGLHLHFTLAAEHSDDRWHTSVNELMGLFRDGLLAVTPILLRARIAVGNEGYDQWDAVVQPLFDQLVEDTIHFSSVVGESVAFDIPTYMFVYDPLTTSYIEVVHRSGVVAPFLGLQCAEDDHDYSLVNCLGDNERTFPFDECEFVCVFRQGSSTTRLTVLDVEDS